MKSDGTSPLGETGIINQNLEVFQNFLMSLAKSMDVGVFLHIDLIDANFNLWKLGRDFFFKQFQPL